jgi:glycosyltransferase involved in cell wall biosynthesis
MDLSVIIPVFNGEKTLPELYRKIRSTLDSRYVYEILFVYDCGKNNSWKVIQELTNSDPSICRGFHLKRNYGQHNALIFGMTKAQGDFIITLDEDLQHDPENIHDFINKQKEGDFDVVYGKFEKLQHEGMRIRTSEILRNMLKRIIPGLYPYYSPYRLIKRETATKICKLKNSYPFIDGYIGWTTDKISDVTVNHLKRVNGSSSYSYYKLLKHATLIIVAYTKAKNCLLVVSSALILVAFVIKILSKHLVNSYSGSVSISTLTTGIILFFIAISMGIFNYCSSRRNEKPVEIK